ncbi:hypothetical protein ZEAMMB73_Zm00001d023285 [Zea mays]|uniref:Uncharacterized protein n=1 Tax=Zea mays TaxID=4577 RepID=A0A1D6IRF5_MAIZE|nr:hypothetical protein ZEAMMB73_Zm00001d023285 [Zea mays]
MSSLQAPEVVEEQSQSQSAAGCSTSRLWKLRWHPQAAHASAAAVPSAPAAMNSRHPSTACPPRDAAWLRWHSRYRTTFAPPSSSCLLRAAAPPFDRRPC